MDRNEAGSVRRLAMCAGIALLVLAACASADTSTIAEEAPPSPSSPATETAAPRPTATTPPSTDEPTEEPIAAPTEAPTEAPPTAPPAEPATEPLPPEPQPVAFEAADGQDLEGHYYPASVNPAPLVVLMHWAPGDASHWDAVARWLQNRGMGDSAASSDPWLDPSWFPPVPDGRSYAVFTFTFRKCGGGRGCQSFEPQGWLEDAKAAMVVARELEGVDPERVVAIGASIGSDGAVDACDEGCQGALALSPGSYLGVPFTGAVSALDGGVPPRPVWCLAAEGDGESAPTCEGASGDLYRSVIYEGSAHGMALIAPGIEPAIPGLILEFLGITLDS